MTEHARRAGIEDGAHHVGHGAGRGEAEEHQLVTQQRAQARIAFGQFGLAFAHRAMQQPPLAQRRNAHLLLRGQRWIVGGRGVVVLPDVIHLALQPTIRAGRLEPRRILAEQPRGDVAAKRIQARTLGRHALAVLRLLHQTTDAHHRIIALRVTVAAKQTRGPVDGQLALLQCGRAITHSKHIVLHAQAFSRTALIGQRGSEAKLRCLAEVRREQRRQSTKPSVKAIRIRVHHPEHGSRRGDFRNRRKILGRATRRVVRLQRLLDTAPALASSPGPLKQRPLAKRSHTRGIGATAQHHRHERWQILRKRP